MLAGRTARFDAQLAQHQGGEIDPAQQAVGPEDHQESKERRGQFSALWGYIFEDYVDEQLRYAHTGREELDIRERRWLGIRNLRLNFAS